MIPLVGTAREFSELAAQVRQTMADVQEKKKYKGKLDISVGTMIEVPRAALVADEIGAEADFFSFGTNDLTQMTFGFSRDDINTFLPDYLRQELLLRDPFQTLDATGVGQLVEMAVRKGRGARNGLKCGICGEHGGDPDSIVFCQTVGLDYVSCSPFRVPIARLAAAQAALKQSGTDTGRKGE
jgi:pyruvate,orthophosphate dikinase